MILVAINSHPGKDLLNLTINACIDIAVSPDLFKQLPVVTLPPPHHRGKYIDLLPGKGLHDNIQDLILRILHHLFACHIGISIGCPCIKKSQEIINFRYSSHGRTGIFIGGFLFNGNHRAQACNLIHVGTFHITQELPGVSTECFNVSSLPLRIDGVKSQGRFPASA